MRGKKKTDEYLYYKKFVIKHVLNKLMDDVKVD